MQLPYRATQRITPRADETLIYTREQALQYLADIETALQRKLRPHDRATRLIARATLLQALGDPRMLEASQEAFDFAKGADTCALLASSHAHHGHYAEFDKYMEMAVKQPHGQGLEVDMMYGCSLLARGRWSEAYKIFKTSKKSMVYALKLHRWLGQDVPEIAVIGEGGFGDLIQYSRYLPILAERGIKATVYLGNHCFENGLVDFFRAQPWYPEIKPISQVPSRVPAVGFFDFPLVLNTQPTDVPPPAPFAIRELQTPSKHYRVGFCPASRSLESPFVSDGVYRTLTEDQQQRILTQAPNDIQFVSLMHDGRESWSDTAKKISGLDLVITVDTAVMHLAASLGIETWVMLSGAVDAKFGRDDDICPWYPKLKIFRNRAFGFDTTVDNVITQLHWES
jgi:hypothetical protein